MTPSVFRLVLAAALFLGWLGYLGWQVLDRPVMNGRPLVVSRPQILASTLDVIAEVPDAGEIREVTVVKVLYPEDSPIKPGATLKVGGIGEAAPRAGPEDRDRQPPLDFAGKGNYLLPLRLVVGEKELYEVQPVPASPGFHPFQRDGTPVVRIYPATPQAEAQYRQVRKPAQ